MASPPAPLQQRLLRRLALRLGALMLLLVASCRGSEFVEGDFIPAARRAQYAVRCRRRLLLTLFPPCLCLD